MLQNMDASESVLNTKITSLIISETEKELTISDILRKVLEQSKAKCKFTKHTSSRSNGNTFGDKLADVSGETTNCIQVTANGILTNDKLWQEKEHIELKQLPVNNSTNNVPTSNVNGFKETNHHLPRHHPVYNPAPGQMDTRQNLNGFFHHNYKENIVQPLNGSTDALDLRSRGQTYSESSWNEAYPT